LVAGLGESYYDRVVSDYNDGRRHVMNAADLMQGIKDACAREDVNPEHVEIRVAHQPQWAFEYSITSEHEIEVVNLGVRDDGEVGLEERRVIYLPEGHQIGYLPAEARESIGW
jgi:hypothetical protein